MKTIFLSLVRQPISLVSTGLVFIIVLAIATLNIKLTTIGSAQELMELFDEYNYSWPPTTEIPSIFIAQFPDDMDSLQASDKKSVFFRALLPMILAENVSIQSQRARLMELIEQDSIQGRDLVELNRLAEEYGLDGDVTDPEVQLKLKRRVDVIPPVLALAQAATESAWGASRFAVEGNNLFGEWTYQEGEGLIPEGRAEGKNHAVRKFKNLQSSIRSYMHNLNSGHAYLDLRRKRAAMRKGPNSIKAKELASGLTRYSSRGDDYVREIQAIIRQNDLDKIEFEAEVLLPDD